MKTLYQHLYKTLGLAIMALGIHSANAQQDPQFTMYNYNKDIVNPAFVAKKAYGEEQVQTRINSFYRNQWSGISGSPRTFALSFITPLNENMTIGANAVMDEVYVLKENHFYGNFAYKLKISDNSNLVFGLKAGLSTLKTDLSSVELIEDDPLFTENQSTSNFNMGMGAWYQISDWYLSVSLPAFFKNKRYEKQNAEPVEGVEDAAIFVGTGYRFKLDDNWGLTPSSMVRMLSGVSTSIDLTATAHYKKIDFGVNYRLDESFTGFVYLDNLDFLSFGLGYEIPTSDINQYASGTFEILLGLKF